MRALFLDRDGVLNVLRPNDYVKCPDELEILPQVAEALSLCRPHFDHIIVVTNQQGIGKGLMTEDDLSTSSGCTPSTASPISAWPSVRGVTTRDCVFATASWWATR